MMFTKSYWILAGICGAALIAGVGLFVWHNQPAVTAGLALFEPEKEEVEPVRVLDVAAYDAKLLALAHRDLSPQVEIEPAANETEETSVAEPPLWPVTDAVYPNVDALLPFHRIVAYYGNFYSTGMGILGEYAPEEVLKRLRSEVQAWNEADPTTPVIPAIDYIASTAQKNPGADGMYRFRMPDEHIQKAIDMAAEVEGMVILEVQIGHADLLTEVQHLEPYLKLPQVHLAIDPEFAMKYRQPPGTAVGTVDAEEVNAVAAYLAELVDAHQLPPKVLIVHRYTRAMVTHADQITPLAQVQIVMDMDGWGPPEQKRDTYEAYIYSEPVQFTGFKLFYKNDVKRPGSRLLTPQEILELTPQPSFIQYQ